MNTSSNRIGDMLVSAKVLTREQIERAAKEAASSGKRIGDILFSKFGVSRDVLDAAADAARARGSARVTHLARLASAGARSITAELKAHA